MSALSDLQNRYQEGDKLTNLETLVVISRDEQAAAELAALTQRAEKAEAELSELREKVSLVIKGYEIFGKPSDFDLAKLADTLRGAA